MKMQKINEYVCPICKEGYITIEEERTGSPGFRDTDYNITNKTCECITYECELIALSIWGTASILEKNHAKSMQDFIEFFG
ncbi:hypothetical protein CN354_15065 [Bacillus cereus]|nr:hypothetical protein CN354_15065 [Bacillus cereus]